MIVKNASVESERVVIVVAKDGVTRQKLVVETRLGPKDADLEPLIAELERFLRDRPDFDTAEIACLGSAD